MPVPWVSRVTAWMRVVGFWGFDGPGGVVVLGTLDKGNGQEKYYGKSAQVIHILHLVQRYVF
jgi:hypothetical protein